jgi:hypothetical protein
MVRLQGFGQQLVEVHERLREQLAGVREASGRGSAGRELLVHCAAFCTALTRHHTGEDDGAFPVLAAEYPELRPVLEELARDHVLIADALQRLQNLDPQQNETELATVAALLETHFTYEERKLTAALNALEDDGSGRLALPFD